MQPEYLTETFHDLTLYLAGPMSGIAQYNYPRFQEISKDLRGAGYNIINPAEQDSEQMQKDALASKDGLVNGVMPVDDKTIKFSGETWGDVMARDVKLVFEKADGVVVMEGWEKSRGARLEVFIANLCGRGTFVYEGNGRIRAMAEPEYLRGITGQMAVLCGGSNFVGNQTK